MKERTIAAKQKVNQAVFSFSNSAFKLARVCSSFLFSTGFLFAARSRSAVAILVISNSAAGSNGVAGVVERVGGVSTGEMVGMEDSLGVGVGVKETEVVGGRLDSDTSGEGLCSSVPDVV